MTKSVDAVPHKVGIVCAGNNEVAPFLQVIADGTVTEKAMLKIYEGTIDSMPVVVLFSDVCRVNAAIAAQILIDTFHTDYIINAGTAGGIDPLLRIFDTVICEESVYHDLSDDILTEFHPWAPSVFFPSDDRLLEKAHHVAEHWDKANGRIYFGRMATGESFITDDGREEICKKLHPLSVDMETAAFAHVCYVNRIPFLAIRTITDTADHSGMDTFEKNCDKAAAIAMDFTRKLLRQLIKTTVEN